MYVFVFPAPFSTVFHWVMQVFSFGYFGILHVCQEMQKTWRKQKKQYQPYVPMGPVVLFCLFFVFSTFFFFLFFLHGCQEEPNTAKIPKDQIIQNSYGSYIFLRSCKSEKFLADANNGVLRAHSAIV